MRARGLAALGVLATLIAGCQQQAPTPRASTAPVVYFQRAPVAGWQSVEWNGRMHAAILADHLGSPYQSPDGSRLAWSPEGDWQIIDRTGKRLGALDMHDYRGDAWADDSSGLCVLRVLTGGATEVGGTYQLDFAGVGRSRTIATIATDKGPNVAACSPSAGRVVITTATGYKDHRTMQHVTIFGELIVMDLTSGAIVRRSRIPADVQSIVVSHDAALGAFATASGTLVVDLTDGHAVRDLPGITPYAFSWDGSLLAAEDSDYRGRVINLSSGEAVWSDPASEVTQGAIPNPRGSELMLFTTTGGLNALLVVNARGVSRTVASDVFLGQVGPCSDCSSF